MNELKDLITWKTKKNRKPLIIRGARQVGKTWLMKTFGQQEYAQ
ncbi:MAG: AAA family ATPase, partial [Sphingobacterium sp.]